MQVQASDSQPVESPDYARPKIGLVLSGGGARGAAHVGVLKVLEENHIPIDMIAGTSFGAIVGGLYASGYSANELEEVLENINWQHALSSQAPRKQQSFRRKQDDDGVLIKFKVGFDKGKFNLPSGLVSPNNLRLILRDLISNVADISDFDKLAIPFRAVATDLENGKAVILSGGNLASAMIASMSVPALFPPYEYKDKLLVDGGVANNLPIDVVREMGADIVIAVDIGSPLKNKEQIASFASVIEQLTLLLTNENIADQLASMGKRDVLITPDLAGFSNTDFESVLKLVPKGVLAAQQAMVKMQGFSLSEQDWVAYLERKAGYKHGNETIDFIRINNRSEFSDKMITAKLHVKKGEKLDVNQLSSDLSEIYGLGLFDEVSYGLVEEDGKNGLDVLVRPRSNGEDFFRFGLTLQDDFEGVNGYTLSASFRNLGLNRRGGEWHVLGQIGDVTRLATEFYQPIDYSQKFFAFASADAIRLNRNLLGDDGILLAQVRLSQLQLQLGGGMNFGRWASLRVALQRTFSEIDGRIGFPEKLHLNQNSTSLNAVFEIDTLDNVNFPQNGMQLGLEYSNEVSLLSGDNGVDTLAIGGFTPFTWGKNTFAFNYRYATSFNGPVDAGSQFDIGGFLNLTAYAPGELSGNHVGSASAIFYRRIAGGSRLLTQTPVFFGGSLEVGNVWNKRSDASLKGLHFSSSVFLGADTLVGPIYIGIGVGDGGKKSAFLFLGQIF